MFDNLPEELNKHIMGFYFRGFKCIFCKLKFVQGYYDPHVEDHCCQYCTYVLMYERGSVGFFESKLFITNYS